ncbi:MAG: winged helix-turn-helix domain-containing protein [Lewinellaceae bacterium]|nr:winged helix-turn-helix domain-containing protein [Lewinellaceae bacterium]
MANKKVLFYGNNDHLLQMLRNSGGASLQVDSIPDANRFLNSQVSFEDTGMIVIYHAPPKADGVSALRNWKRKNPTVPAIVVTSDYTGPTTRLLLKSGAEDVLGFPANSDDILSCFEAYLPGFKLKPAAATRYRSRGIGGKALLAAVTPGMMAAGVQFSQTVPPPMPPTMLPLLEQGNEEAYRGLEISFFGPFTVHINGRKIELTNQAKYLFAYLAYHYPRTLSRDHLARTFWADKFENTPEFARKSLNVELTHIRKTFRNQAGFEQDLIVFAKNAYRLKLDRPLLSDVLTFKELHQKIQDYRRRDEEIPDEILQNAIKTYRGNFLDDFPTDTFSWVEIEQQHLSAVFEQIADLYSEQLCAKFDYWKAIAVCNEILSRDARMEVIHRRAMQCYASLGMAHKVEAQYNLCCKMMEQEFQSKPSPETTRLYEHIIKKVA